MYCKAKTCKGLKAADLLWRIMYMQIQQDLPVLTDNACPCESVPLRPRRKRPSDVHSKSTEPQRAARNSVGLKRGTATAGRPRSTGKMKEDEKKKGGPAALTQLTAQPGACRDLQKIISQSMPRIRCFVTAVFSTALQVGFSLNMET